MGASSSKAARRLPTKTPSAVHPPVSEAAEPAAPPQSSSTRPADAATQEAFVYGGLRESPRAASSPSFSGEKDDAILQDAMDPQFLSNLSRLGPVDVPQASRLVRAPARAQRTLNARKDEYTRPTVTPPPGTVTASMLTTLLDELKLLPPGADPSRVYRQFGLTAEQLAPVRRWVNSPSVGDEELVEVRDGGNMQVEQSVELKVGCELCV
ncbi:hypothetical protein VHUM_01800 [Vanrija humicola]|uniref:Uncharacterized protein n=1 Tax=Vanrija humicola TaxID=5417 RepID=A0A7D8V1R8_VANHU|nr:hypothetical protein VHUM_01800 [Vanrija humicola]